MFGYQYTTLMNNESRIVVSDLPFPSDEVLKICSKSMPAIVEIEINSPLLMQVVKEEKISLGGKIGTLGKITF